MSIVRLKKVTLCGLIGEKTKVLESLQALGCLHLVSLRPPPKEPEKAPPARPEDAYKALRYLLDCPQKRRQLSEDPAFDLNTVVDRILANQQQTREFSDHRDFLKHRIQGLEPWGEFSFPPPEELAGYKLWFYSVPHDKLRQLASVDLTWQIVGRDSRNSYVVAIARDEPPPYAMPVPRTHTGALSISELQRRLEMTELELEDLAAERASLTRWIFLITRHLAEAENQAALRHAAEQTLDQDELFAVQGWLPFSQQQALARFAEARRLALLVENPAPADQPPTLLDNPDDLGGGEDLVHFFQTPGYRSWDPSLILFFSFALFFAMILSDAGYAAVLLLGLLFFWRRLGLNPQKKKLRNLCLALFSAALAYGILAGSYFGLSPPAGSLPAAFKQIDLNDYDDMMRLSILIGVLHLALANGFLAWRWRNSGPYAPLGWIAALLGGTALWLGYAPAGWLFLTGGLATVFVFSSERPIQRPFDWLWRAFDGLLALAKLSQAFGDVLSYLRLFALGLASASLALTFNQLAHDAAASTPGLGLLLALLILLAGHALNLALCVMSGVVHGLRLNFIEFYNWGVPEEGYPFRAFAKKEIHRE